MPRSVQAGERNPAADRGGDGTHAAARADPGRDLLRPVAAAALLATLVAFALAAALGLGLPYLAAVGFALLVGVLLLLGQRDAYRSQHPHAAFGAANGVTLARAVGVALLAGLAFEPVTELRAWSAVALATVTAALDALDGRLARRSGLASRFGARFDMETDALLILVLAALAWGWERAGAWVLLSGLMRYGFVLAGVARNWLAGELPSSRRRQAVCVVQVVGLILVLVPWLPPALAAAVAAVSLAALCYSFAVDVLWLARRRTREGFTA